MSGNNLIFKNKVSVNALPLCSKSIESMKQKRCDVSRVSRDKMEVVSLRSERTMTEQDSYMSYNNNVIKKLLNLQWWNWSDQKINDMLPILCSNNIDKL